MRWLDPQNRQASGVRHVKSTTTHEIGALLSEYGGLNSVSSALVAGDLEIDLENTGRFVTKTSRVYVDKNRGIVRNVRFMEILKNADRSVCEERPRQLAETNISTETPLLRSGVYVPKAKAIRKFVFSGKSQLHHGNGLTFDFLHAMAKELKQRNSLMLLGAGPKSYQPLVLGRGATLHRGFSEGRTDGDRYCLLQHFSNLELKLPKLSDEAQ